VKTVCAALLYGAVLAWIDTRPNWDDTGISAALVVAGSAVLAAMAPSLWPVIALAVTLPLVAANVAGTGTWAAVLAIPFGLVGALVGWLPRKVAAHGD
jgi:hypothetical protein